MDKIATVQDALNHAADVMEKVADERDWYKERYLQLRKEADVNEVLGLMKERDLQPGVSMDAIRADLHKQAAEGRLEITKEAVLMSGHGGGIVTLGGADDQSSGKSSEMSKAQLNSILLGEED